MTTPTPLYLRITHGRNNPNEDLEDWGFDGPHIGPFHWMHGTYFTTFRLGTEDESGREAELHLHGDLLVVEGKFYGDWTVIAYPEGKPEGRILSLEDLAAQKLPDTAGRGLVWIEPNLLAEARRFLLAAKDRKFDSLADAFTRRIAEAVVGSEYRPCVPSEHAWGHYENPKIRGQTHFQCSRCKVFGIRKHAHQEIEVVDKLPDPNEIIVCTACGSDRVEWLDWVTANGRTPTATYEGEDTWCPVCAENDLGAEPLADFTERTDRTPNLDCDDPSCPGWCHMDDSMGRGPNVERCDTCKVFPDDGSAIEAHDRQCISGAQCEYRTASEE